MALGTINQVRGPFSSGYTLNISPAGRIGISVGQDDFMSWGSHIDPETGHYIGKDIIFTINGQQIHLGKTYMYQTGQQINNTILIFPEGAPSSTKVEYVSLPIEIL